MFGSVDKKFVACCVCCGFKEGGDGKGLCPILPHHWAAGQGKWMTTELIQLTNDAKPAEVVAAISAAPKAVSGAHCAINLDSGMI
jgi:hypothetical protein